MFFLILRVQKNTCSAFAFRAVSSKKLVVLTPMEKPLNSHSALFHQKRAPPARRPFRSHCDFLIYILKTYGLFHIFHELYLQHFCQKAMFLIRGHLCDFILRIYENDLRLVFLRLLRRHADISHNNDQVSYTHTSSRCSI